ncbi:MAG: hypothetical protein M1826_007012 [Phylliscum demangeonii]|nr:MAG: hypothetical protein M1826_007012 [Phylliscum demangeonii]
MAAELASTGDEEMPSNCYRLIYTRVAPRPVLPSLYRHQAGSVWFAHPVWAPLLFDNIGSDARDHCASERTFLSWLRLAIYMAIVSAAIVVSFHLNREPTQSERRMAMPLGITFWILAMACLAAGFANYVTTVAKYSRREALVQSGWTTQVRLADGEETD